MCLGVWNNKNWLPANGKYIGSITKKYEYDILCFALENMGINFKQNDGGSVLLMLLRFIARSRPQLRTLVKVTLFFHPVSFPIQ